MRGTTRPARRRSRGDKSDVLDFVASASCSLCISQKLRPEDSGEQCHKSKARAIRALTRARCGRGETQTFAPVQTRAHATPRAGRRKNPSVERLAQRPRLWRLQRTPKPYQRQRAEDEQEQVGGEEQEQLGVGEGARDLKNVERGLWVVAVALEEGEHREVLGVVKDHRRRRQEHEPAQPPAPAGEQDGEEVCEHERARYRVERGKDKVVDAYETLVRTVVLGSVLGEHLRDVGGLVHEGAVRRDVVAPEVVPDSVLRVDEGERQRRDDEEGEGDEGDSACGGGEDGFDHVALRGRARASLEERVKTIEACARASTLRPERERQLDGAARGDDAPALSVYLDARQPLGRLDEDALVLLRRKRGIGFEHAGDGRGDDGRGERGAVHELVVLADDVGLVELDRDELADEVLGKCARLVDVAVYVLTLFDELEQLFVRGAVEPCVQLGLGGRGRVRKYWRGHPDAGRDDLGLLQPVGGRAVGRAVETVARAVERVLVVQAADRDGRGRGGGRDDGVAGLPARVADGADDDQPLVHGALDRLAQGVVEVRHILIAAGRDVDDADAVLLAVLDHPAQAALDVLLGDVAGLADLDQHDVAVGRDGAEEAAGERAVAGGDDRGHHAVPARRFDGVERAGAFGDDVVVGEDAAVRRRQVGVRVEARVEESDGHAPPREALVRAEPEPRGQDVSPLLEDGGVLLQLRARAREQLDAAPADGRHALARVGRDQPPQLFGQPFERGHPLAGLAPADRTDGSPRGHLRRVRRLFDQLRHSFSTLTFFAYHAGEHAAAQARKDEG